MSDSAARDKQITNALVTVAIWYLDTGFGRDAARSVVYRPSAFLCSLMFEPLRLEHHNRADGLPIA